MNKYSKTLGSIITIALTICAIIIVLITINKYIQERERLNDLRECLEPYMEEYCESKGMIVSSFNSEFKRLNCKEDEWNDNVRFKIPVGIIKLCEVNE